MRDENDPIKETDLGNLWICVINNITINANIRVVVFQENPHLYDILFVASAEGLESNLWLENWYASNLDDLEIGITNQGMIDGVLAVLTKDIEITAKRLNRFIRRNKGDE